MRERISKQKAHDEKNARRGYQVSAWDVVATANPFCDLPWVRRGRKSCKAEILPKAHDEKSARRGYQLCGNPSWVGAGRRAALRLLQVLTRRKR
jgi:hypothetical protein